VGDKLTTSNFGTGTHWFAASEDSSVAVCVLPGTELSFADEVTFWPDLMTWRESVIKHKTAILRQIAVVRYQWMPKQRFVVQEVGSRSFLSRSIDARSGRAYQPRVACL
jgi:hypothetical protein